MKNKISSRHHYLPQFYLKGFTNEKGTFAVYDKAKNKLKRGEYTPKTHFFENGRNTIIVDGQEDDFIERKLYERIDNRLAPVFERIYNTNGNFLNLENIFHLKSFIAFLYWRVPKNDHLLDVMVKNLDFKELGLLFKYKKDGVRISKDEEDRFRNDPIFRKMCSLVLPFSTFIPYIEGEEKLWKPIYTTDNSNPLHLTCDFPLILAKPKEFLTDTQRLIIPINSKHLLFYGKDLEFSMRPPEFSLKLDLAIFHQAQRYVCGPNGGYLNAVAGLYEVYKANNQTHRIIPEVLEYL